MSLATNNATHEGHKETVENAGKNYCNHFLPVKIMKVMKFIN